MNLVGIVGLGVVGNAVAANFEKHGCEVRRYDGYQRIGAPNVLCDCRHILICVPTPLSPWKQTGWMLPRWTLPSGRWRRWCRPMR